MGKVLMVQGTGSHAGKSLLVMALCRIFSREGLRVAPFKAQNMSLNSFVTPDGCEFSRAQAVQAEAAGVAPLVEMNPILLKPQDGLRSQVVAMGKPLSVVSAREYWEMTPQLWPLVTRSLDTLREGNDIVVIEGAGSPAEINLREQEIVNMRVARYAEAPVILVGDIDRGGVFASLFGTVALLEPEERALIQALVVNKFRGDPSLLDSGLASLKDRTGVPVAGVLPYFKDVQLPEEDSVGLENSPRLRPDPEAPLDIAVIRLPRIANFDDFDPLRREPGVRLRYVDSPGRMGSPDLVVIPGSKTTVADLEWMRQAGLDRSVSDHRGAGRPVIGLCGGYQMLGQRILDPERVESDRPETDGLGLLPVKTVFESGKETHQVRADIVSGSGLLTGSRGGRLAGYEIHMGRSCNAGNAPFRIRERSGKPADAPEGALDSQGLTLGTYLHGLFHNHGFRRGLLLHLAAEKNISLPAGALQDMEREYDRLADLVSRHLDMDAVHTIAGLKP